MSPPGAAFWRVWQRYMDPGRLVFLDETGACTNMVRRYPRWIEGRGSNRQSPPPRSPPGATPGGFWKDGSPARTPSRRVLAACGKLATPAQNPAHDYLDKGRTIIKEIG